MPDLCVNKVSFSGETAAVMKAYAAFYDFAEGKLKLPGPDASGLPECREPVLENERYFSYFTDEGPNLQHMAAYAAHFGADHRHYYINPGSLLCGEMVTQDGSNTHTRLVASDLELINHDAACEQFEFRNSKAEDPHELWPVMLKEKQKAMQHYEVRRRLSGELPHILLGPDDYIIDLENRAFLKADERSHRVSMHNMQLKADESAYIMFYYLPARQAVPPPRDLRECPDNVWILEIPREWELDPIGHARVQQGEDSDHVLSYPCQSYRCATPYSAAEYLELQRQNQRGR